MEMRSISYKNFINGLGIISIILMVTMPDVVIDLITHLVHQFFELVSELLFVCFESLESLLDKIVEDIFDTELRETQLIVFYVMLVSALFPLYLLWLRLVRFYNMLTKSIPIGCLRFLSYWEDLSLYDKLKLSILSLSCVYLTLFVFN
jgi:hypothetical protein